MKAFILSFFFVVPMFMQCAEFSQEEVLNFDISPESIGSIAFKAKDGPVRLNVKNIFGNLEKSEKVNIAWAYFLASQVMRDAIKINQTINPIDGISLPIKSVELQQFIDFVKLLAANYELTEAYSKAFKGSDGIEILTELSFDPEIIQKIESGLE